MDVSHTRILNRNLQENKYKIYKIYPNPKFPSQKMQLWWTGLITFWYEDHDFSRKALYMCHTTSCRISNSGQSQTIREHQPSLADLRARGTCAPFHEGPISFNFMQFLGNFGKIVYWWPPPLPLQELAPKPRGNPASATESYFWKLHQNKNKTAQLGGGDNEEAFHVFTLSESVQTIKHDNRNIATGKLSDYCTHSFIRGICGALEFSLSGLRWIQWIQSQKISCNWKNHSNLQSTV